MLLVWHALPQDERAALEELRRNFEAAHPTVDVQLVAHPADALLETFRQQTLAGAGPDLLVFPRSELPALAESGLIQALDDSLIARIMVNQPIALSTATLSGTAYGVTLATEFPTLYYRRDLLTPSFVSVEDFVAQAKTVGLVIPPTFAATAGLLLVVDPEPFDDDGPSPSALLSYFTALTDLATSPSVHFTTDPAPFLGGSAALLIASSNDYPRLADAVGDDLGVATWPGHGLTSWRVPVQGEPVIAISLNITRQNADAANQVVAYLLAPDSQSLWFARTGQAPVNPYALPDRELVTAWGNALRWGFPVPIAPESAVDALAALDSAVREVVLQGLPPATAVEHVQSALSAP
jgi:ABC-type glycerol-3-phosphate transport system substrate-binding protein